MAQNGVQSNMSFGPTLSNQVQDVLLKYENAIKELEEISFFRMEYFLYGSKQASQMIRSRDMNERNFDDFEEEIKEREREIERILDSGDSLNIRVDVEAIRLEILDI